MSHSSTLAYVVDEAASKQQVLLSEPGRYLLSAAMAGALIAVVLAVSLKLGQVFFASGAPGYYIATSGFFGVALVSIIVCKVELFTSNVMYFTVGRLSGRCRTCNMLRSWTMVYLGNLLGVLLFVAVLAGAGGMGVLPADHLLFNVVEHKVHASSMEIFWKGVLCNWVICLAVWVPMRLSNEAARLLIIMLLVFVFFFSGFEHSIANMAFFALAKLQGMAGLEWADIAHNLVPATLGNIVGGAFGVGLVVYLLERHTLKAV
ncbi:MULTISPECIES: formate transporter FocA [Chromobacterium]|jgi:nitrite transporter NirC|uniref:Transporter n=2 Tax=Chromobacterium TaxID=535 RepID=A0A2K4MTS4_9NEIS|nr:MULTISPECIES: formate transporter FocA [Chromobacterium]MBM2883250.1 formate transporter FocA [Chromobacterium amazonense]MDE1712717.1 formate transporter FocA [Chromobacterium amazonense]MDQ4540461.1 formate transporter FocA [Chromobacterium amazonense]POB00383.1 transporter [Chromobacterium sinusclupearum]